MITQYPAREPTLGANASSAQVTFATIGGHSKSWELVAANADRKELIVLNHGTLGSLHLYFGGAQPANGSFISAMELFFHDVWVEDRFTGVVWAQWHEPDEVIAAAVAVTFQSADDTVTLVAHGLNSHSAVTFPSITTTTGISINTTYYVINTGAADTFKLATSKANVLTSTAIDLLTGNGTGTIIHAQAFTGFVNYTQVTV